MSETPEIDSGTLHATAEHISVSIAALFEMGASAAVLAAQDKGAYLRRAAFLKRVGTDASLLATALELLVRRMR